jgi:hypothetical protein
MYIGRGSQSVGCLTVASNRHNAKNQFSTFCMDQLSLPPGQGAGRRIYALLRDQIADGTLPAGSTREDFEARHAVFPVNLTGPEVAARVDADGFVEVLDAPTGFMLIERSVFERLAQALPELRYTPDRMEDEAAAAWPHHRFFDVWAEPGNGRYLSEDFAFCRRWQSIGGQVFVDTRSRLTHTGTRVYRGDYARSLAASAGPSA